MSISIVQVICLLGEKIFRTPNLFLLVKKGGGVLLELSHELDYFLIGFLET